MNTASRRQFLSTVTAGWAAVAGAQTAPAGRTFRIGILSHLYPKEQFLVIPALAKLGYVEGVNVVYETRYTAGNPDLLRKGAEELVALKADLIIAPMSFDGLTAKAATSTIPILTTLATAALEFGLFESYARPGTNVTGTTWWLPGTAAKVIDSMRIILPKAKRMADLYQTDRNGFSFYLDARRNAGRSMGLDVTTMEIRDEADLEKSLAKVRASRTEVLFTTDQVLLESHRPQILEFARKHRILTLAPRRLAVESGIALGFFPDYRDIHLRSAAIADKILRGANPADIPVEMPMRQSLVLNARSLDAIGIHLTPRMRSLATEIIE